MRRVLGLLSIVMSLAVAPVLAQTPARPAPATVPAPAPPARPVAPAKPAAAPAATPATADAKRIDLNSASESELDGLPGVGPVRARAIVANRPYDSLESVTAKKALPANVLASLRGRVALANINASTAKDMQQTLPGIGDVRASQIVSGRPYAAPADLVSKGVLTQALFDKIKDVITF